MEDTSGKATTSNAEAAGPSSSAAAPNLDDLLKDFYADVRDVDRDNEVNRILWAFKLNPYERMNLKFDCSMDDIKKQFRKLSLLVHPDKCKHPQASTAFEVLGEALKQLSDEEHRNFTDQVLNTARDEIRKERKKETKHDSLVRVASLLNEGGRASVEEQWEQSDEFHDRWIVKGREYLAKTEWKRRKTIHRLKDEVKRSEAEAAEAKEKAKKKKEQDKQWDQGTEERVNSWRDYQGVGKGKRPGEDDLEGSKGVKKAIGELKPPKIKTSDEDKTFITRNITEQFRPTSTQPSMKQNQMKK